MKEEILKRAGELARYTVLFFKFDGDPSLGGLLRNLINEIEEELRDIEFRISSH